MFEYRLDPLWLRLAFLERETKGGELSLPRLVAERLGLDAAAARQLVEEYRRFLFLLLRAGHAVEPPPAIAAVVQLHERMALNYWGVLAAMITERPLVEGGSTLAESYQRIFGEAPPAGIWSAPEHGGSILARLSRRLTDILGKFGRH